MLRQIKFMLLLSVFCASSACTIPSEFKITSTSIPNTEQEAITPPGTNLPPSPTREIIPTNQEATMPIPSESVILIRDHSQARDAAMQHVSQTYDLPAPDAWSTEDITPEDMLGASTFRYTSGAWVVQVSAPVVALDQTIYTVVIDHLKSGLHWEGMVNAFGDIAQVSVTPPAQIDSPERARDQVVIYLQQKYGLSLPGEWTLIDTPQTMIGATRYRYVSDPWTINVIAPAGTLLASVYQVTLDNLSEKIKWQGEITSQGVVTERSFTQGE